MRGNSLSYVLISAVRGDEEEAVCTVKSEALLQKRGELELRNI